MKSYTYINYIESSRREFDNLPETEWRKDYFDKSTGGYLVTSWDRITQAEKSHQEYKKFEKEHATCLVYARDGHRIKHLPDKKGDREGTYDTIFDDLKADLKRTKSTNNIIKYASRATKKQGAQIILFEFEIWNNDFRNLIDELVRKDYHGRYFITGEDKTHQF